MASKSATRHRRPRKEDDDASFDPVYHALSRMNGKVNRMNKVQLQRQLNSLGLNTSGVVEVLRKRLKNHYKKQKIDTVPELDSNHYLVVIDFEATCEEESPDDYVHEIIEFPAVLIDKSSATIIDEFHSYCKPTLHPELSEFCTRLTGISQEKVDSADSFSSVFQNFEEWLTKHNILHEKRRAFVTDGPWDFCKFLHVQCCLSGIKFPKWAKKWINVKKIYGNFYKLKKPRIMDMLSNIGLEFEGRLHCGMDDTRNIARIVIKLLEDGASFNLNERFAHGRFRHIPQKESPRTTASIRHTSSIASSNDTLEKKENEKLHDCVDSDSRVEQPCGDSTELCLLTSMETSSHKKELADKALLSEPDGPLIGETTDMMKSLTFPA